MKIKALFRGDELVAWMEVTERADVAFDPDEGENVDNLQVGDDAVGQGPEELEKAIYREHKRLGG